MRQFLLTLVAVDGDRVFNCLKHNWYSTLTGYKCKLSLSLRLLYLVDLIINKYKTKFNDLFLQNDFKYKKNSQLLLKKVPRKNGHCAPKL